MNRIQEIEKDFGKSRLVMFRETSKFKRRAAKMGFDKALSRDCSPVYDICRHFAHELYCRDMEAEYGTDYHDKVSYLSGFLFPTLPDRYSFLKRYADSIAEMKY